MSRRALALALVQALYFAGTVFYVKSAIRERGSPTFLALGMGDRPSGALTAPSWRWTVEEVPIAFPRA